MKTLILGVGGAGTNLIKAMQQAPNRTLLAVNTDAASLSESGLANTLLIGKDVCDGQPTGGLVELGKLEASF